MFQFRAGLSDFPSPIQSVTGSWELTALKARPWMERKEVLNAACLVCYYCQVQVPTGLSFDLHSICALWRQDLYSLRLGSRQRRVLQRVCRCHSCTTMVTIISRVSSLFPKEILMPCLKLPPCTWALGKLWSLRCLLVDSFEHLL